MAVILKTPDELLIMREAGRINAQALQAMREAVRPGVSTYELDQRAAAVLRKHSAKAAFLGYPPGGPHPYPATVTVSINEELVHGIPRKDRLLQEGDIVSLDCGTIHKGFVADSALTVGVGTISGEARRLLDVTEQALAKAIEVAQVGAETADISRTVQELVERHGFNVVREYTGHGVGRTMHEDPQVPNWWPVDRKKRRGWRSYPLTAGMTFAIEPMVIIGRPETRVLDDHWTVVTADGSLCAHFEHTIAIAPEGPPLVLTAL